MGIKKKYNMYFMYFKIFKTIINLMIYNVILYIIMIGKIYFF